MFVSVCLQLFVKAGLLQNCSCTVALAPSGHVGGLFFCQKEIITRADGGELGCLFAGREVCVCVLWK